MGAMIGRRIVRVLFVLGFVPACFSSAASPDRRLTADGPPCMCGDKRPLGDVEADMPPVDGGSVRIRILREPTSLLSLVDSDPLTAAMINHVVLETLVRLTDDPDTVVPELASAFEVDETNNRYTFHLAENARWHDGRPVTSTDVRFVFGKLSDPFNPLPPAEVFTTISDIDTPDEDTVVFTLDKREPDFLAAVATIPIVPMHVFGRTPLSQHEASRAPVGSGPFRFVRWVPSQFIELERNPDWRGHRPHIDQVQFAVVPDNRIAVDMFSHGDLDVILDFPVGAAPPTESGRIVSFPTPFWESLLFNARESAFSDPEVRRAVSMLIDRKTIRCAALECQATLPFAETATESPSTSEDAMIFRAPSFSPQAAALLLDKAGWEKREGVRTRTKNGRPLAFSLLVPALGRDTERAAVIFQEDLAEAGLDMKIVTVSRGAFMGRLNAGRFDVASVPLEIGSTFGQLSQFHSKSASIAAASGVRDPLLDDLIDQLRAEKSTDKQRCLFADAANRLTYLCPVSFLFRTFGAALIRSDTAGVEMRRGFPDLMRIFRTRSGR